MRTRKKNAQLLFKKKLKHVILTISDLRRNKIRNLSQFFSKFLLELIQVYKLFICSLTATH